MNQTCCKACCCCRRACVRYHHVSAPATPELGRSSSSSEPRVNTGCWGESISDTRQNKSYSKSYHATKKKRPTPACLCRKRKPHCPRRRYQSQRSCLLDRPDPPPASRPASYSAAAPPRPPLAAPSHPPRAATPRPPRAAPPLARSRPPRAAPALAPRCVVFSPLSFLCSSATNPHTLPETEAVLSLST